MKKLFAVLLAAMLLATLGSAALADTTLTVAG